MALNRPTDESLLECYLEGDRAAFRELIGRYQNELLHFLTHMLEEAFRIRV